MSDRITITVGQEKADIVGSDNKAIQSAVDYVAGLGGGTVIVLAGTYLMRDSLHLRSNITLLGQGDRTILRKSDGFKSALATDGDYGQEEITPVDPSGFEIGMGVTIADNNSGGFHTTVATIVARDGDTFIINKPLNADCMVARNAYVQNTFPVISGYYIENVNIQNITIDGNKDKNEYLNGCRGAGIFLYRAKNATIKACTIYSYNGDGISFQQSNDIIVEYCISRNNASLGFHPGSGSQRPTIRGCSSYNNGSDGLFLCWRVKNGLFENNQIFNNGQFGISIGHKDTDNIFRKNVIYDNKSHGVFFRNEPEYTGGHRNLLENNVIINNGKGGEGSGIYINGETYDITIINNDISDKKPDNEKTQQYGIWIGAKAKRIKIKENIIEGNKFGAIKNDSDDPEIEINLE